MCVVSSTTLIMQECLRWRSISRRGIQQSGQRACACSLEYVQAFSIKERLGPPRASATKCTRLALSSNVRTCVCRKRIKMTPRLSKHHSYRSYASSRQVSNVILFEVSSIISGSTPRFSASSRQHMCPLFSNSPTVCLETQQPPSRASVLFPPRVRLELARLADDSVSVSKRLSDSPIPSLTPSCTAA